MLYLPKLCTSGLSSYVTQVIQLPRNSITLYGNESTDDHDSLSYEWSLSPESKDKVVEMQVRYSRSLCVIAFTRFSLDKRIMDNGGIFFWCVFREYGHRSCSCLPCRRETTPFSWLWQTQLDSRTPPRSPSLCSQVNSWTINFKKGSCLPYLLTHVFLIRLLSCVHHLNQNLVSQNF